MGNKNKHWGSKHKFLTGRKDSRIDPSAFFKNWKFTSPKVHLMQAGKISSNVLMGLVIFNLICNIIFYITQTVFYGKDLPLRDFLSEWVFGFSFNLTHILIVIASACIFMGIFFAQKRIGNKAITVDKMASVDIVGRYIPEFKNIVEKRIKTQGFISEMDYEDLRVDQIYSEIITIYNNAVSKNNMKISNI